MIHVIIPTTPDRRELALRCAKSVEEHSNYPHTTTLFENDYIGWPKAVLKAIEGIHDNELVVLMESDVVAEPNWLAILAQAFFAKFTDGNGCAEPYNEFHNGNLIQHPLCKASLLRETIYPLYFHNFADNEMSDKILATGRYLYVPEAKIAHLHWVNGKAPQDTSYQNATSNHELDRELYFKRKASNFK